MLSSFDGGRAAVRFLRALTGLLLLASFSASSSADSGMKVPLQTLHEFQASEGDVPGPLTLANDGRFYGAATYGGTLKSGTVFAMDKGGNLEVLHSFDPAVDGYYPSTKLLSASDGYLYGTVMNGGQFNCGSIFRISPSTGLYEVVHAFAASGRRLEGCQPSGAMVEGQDGWIFGTTESRGKVHTGTVYKWNFGTRDFTTLRNFANVGSSDGYTPSGVALAPSGELYGVTYQGGKFNLGTVYSLKTDGSDYQVRYSFTYETDTIGDHPGGQLLLAKDGNFYGYTTSGGKCCGTVFRMALDGTVSLVYTFEFSGAIGWPVRGDLTLGPGGLMYGVTNGSGAAGGGTVFSMSTSGEAQVMQAFAYSGTPNSPYTGLTLSGSYMYGAASRGYSEGTLIYRVLKK